MANAMKKTISQNQSGKKDSCWMWGDASTKSSVKSIKIYTVDNELSLPRHGHCSIDNYIWKWSKQK